MVKFCIFLILGFFLNSKAQVNLTSLRLQLDPPKSNVSDEQTSAQEKNIQLSLRPEFQRRPVLKASHNGTATTAATVAESAMHIIQQYIPGLMAGNNTLRNALNTVSSKLRSTAQTSSYVNPLGLPCDPKLVRLCYSRVQMTKSSTTTAPPLFDYLLNDPLPPRKKKKSPKTLDLPSPPRQNVYTPSFFSMENSERQSFIFNILEKAMSHVLTNPVNDESIFR